MKFIIKIKMKFQVCMNLLLDEFIGFRWIWIKYEKCVINSDEGLIDY